ncbi:uroporphyrinogen-III synthase [Brevundimonas variabilis]|uniref:Uroporphyrinogen-III synthase n=1 Tax=Brevundimonas variabilis TaxID=74312 RepID=A0A7W9FDG6_9CAUL|nr:uroporphyrinogen-III synthase [Brevundimonas variabilis]MBB5745242.1 uroporphyrinogen-III synthase [Brevundimonas variabilis]
MPPIRRVWVTRAEPGATRTAEALTALGFEPVVQPLLAVRFLAPPLYLDGVDTLGFTSRNGVAAFAALTPDRHWPVLTVGDATAVAAREAGFVTVTSASGAVGDLATLIRETHGSGTTLLHVSARVAAADLGSHVGDGVTVRTLVAYETVETGCTPPQAFEAILVHSPRAARILATLLTPDLAGRCMAVAISDAAALALRSLGLASLRVAAQPNEASVTAALGKPGSPV